MAWSLVNVINASLTLGKVVYPLFCGYSIVCIPIRPSLEIGFSNQIGNGQVLKIEIVKFL